jgi:hypothetical protein
MMRAEVESGFVDRGEDENRCPGIAVFALRDVHVER